MTDKTNFDFEDLDKGKLDLLRLEIAMFGDGELFGRTQYSPGQKPSSGKHVTLDTHPHYSNPRFKNPHYNQGRGGLYRDVDVYGAKEEGLTYDYWDRLQFYDGDSETWDLAHSAMEQSELGRRTCAWYEAFFSVYYNRPVEIRHIQASIRSDGYPWTVFGYRFTDDVV